MRLNLSKSSRLLGSLFVIINLFAFVSCKPDYPYFRSLIGCLNFIEDWVKGKPTEFLHSPPESCCYLRIPTFKCEDQDPYSFLPSEPEKKNDGPPVTLSHGLKGLKACLAQITRETLLYYRPNMGTKCCSFGIPSIACAEVANVSSIASTVTPAPLARGGHKWRPSWPIYKDPDMTPEPQEVTTEAPEEVTTEAPEEETTEAPADEIQETPQETTTKRPIRTTKRPKPTKKTTTKRAKPTMKRTTKNPNSEDQWTTEEPCTEEPSTKKPSKKKPFTRKPSTEETEGEEPASEEPASERPASVEPASEEPASEGPGSEKPASEEPGSEKPASVEPGSGEPGSEEPSAQRPPVEADGSGSSEGSNQPNKEEKRSGQSNPNLDYGVGGP